MQPDQCDKCLLRTSSIQREGCLCIWGIYKNERVILKSTLQLESLNNVYK